MYKQTTYWLRPYCNKTVARKFVYIIIPFSMNPLTPKSDEHLISPHNIIPQSNNKDMSIGEMITNQRSSWLLNKFSFPIPKEKYREECGEYGNWRIFIHVFLLIDLTWLRHYFCSTQENFRLKSKRAESWHLITLSLVSDSSTDLRVSS